MSDNVIGKYINEQLKVYWVADIRLKDDFGILKNCWIYEKDNSEPLNDYDKISYILEYEYDKIEFQNKCMSGYTNCNCIAEYKIHKIIS